MRTRVLVAIALLAVFLVVATVGLVLAQPPAPAPAPTPAAPAAPANAVMPSANPQAWGPVLLDLTPTSARIAYKTATTAPVTVRCDGRDFPATDKGVFHSAMLTGLKPGSEHVYQIITTADGQPVDGDKYTFLTPAQDLTTFTFGVYGDTRTNTGDHKSVIDAIVPHQPVLLINTGDLVENGWSEDAWNKFFPVLAPLVTSIPYYPALGNHERNSSLYYDFFDLPAGGGQDDKQWYSFTYGDAFFAVLDGDMAWPQQAQWLDDLLTKAQGKYRWKFVAFHQPPFSSGTHGSDPHTLQYFVPILEKHHVDMVFCGHDHIYERSEKAGVVYIISGGGGAPRYLVDQTKNPYSKVAVSSLHYCLLTVDGDTLKLQVSKPDGTVIDEFTLTHRGQ